MAFTQITDTLNVHQSRADQPTETASQLKVLFDTDVNTIKTRVNAFIDELEAVTDGTSGSDSIGMTPITETGAENTVQGIVEALVTYLTSVVNGSAGADLIGMTVITQTGANATVQSVIESIISQLIATTDSSSGADLVGATAISGGSATTVQGILEELKALSPITIPDGTITNTKLATDIKVGSLASLTTDATSSVVGAINELDAKLPTTNIVSVLDKGAIGDGVTNDTQAIQDTIDEVHTDGGGIVYIPEGTYLITGVINFCLSLYGDTKLIGEGTGLSTLKIGSAAALCEFIYCASGEGFTITDLTIDGNNQANIQNGIAFALANNGEIRRINFINLEATLGAITINDSDNNIISDIRIVDSSAHGITIKNGSKYNKISNCNIDGGNFGYYIYASNYNQFINCLASSTTFTSVLEGFNIDGGEHNQFTNCISYGRGDGGFIETNVLSGVYPKYNTVKGLIVHDNKLTGITITGSYGVYEGIISYNNGKGSTPGQQAGVNVYSSASKNVITNINSYDLQGVATQKYGVLVVSGSVDNIINNIVGEGNTDALMLDNNAIAENGDYKFEVNNNNVALASVLNLTHTKILFTNAVYNIGDCYDTTLGRFKPNKAGVYNLHATIRLDAALVDQASFKPQIWKNGVFYRYGPEYISSGIAAQSMSIDLDVYADGVNDYFEVDMYQSSGSTITINPDPNYTYMFGSLRN